MNNRLLAGLALSLLLALLAACGDDGDSASATLEWSADITSAARTLHTVQSTDEAIYGWNLLVGETEIDGEAVDVEMLGNVAYVGGSGPFFGFITLTFANGDLLGMRMDGDADAFADTSRAGLRADLTIIGGTGRYAGASGDGEWTGYRDQQLGGLVHLDAVLSVRAGD